jgi:uncharacterized protein YndB with AHSA1/START domain
MNPKNLDLDAWLAGTGRLLQRDGDRIRSVVVRRRFAAPIEKVWAAWVDGWTTRVVSGTPRPGETVVLDLGQPKRTTSRILVCAAPTRLGATWTYGEPTPARPDEVETRLARHEAGTLLELEHRSESGSEWAGGVGAGWEAGLLMFDVRFGGGDPAVIPVDVAFPRLDALWTELVARSGSQI